MVGSAVKHASRADFENAEHITVDGFDTWVERTWWKAVATVAGLVLLDLALSLLSGFTWMLP